MKFWTLGVIGLVGSTLAILNAAPLPKTEKADVFPTFVRVGGCEMTQDGKEITLKGPKGDRSFVQTTKEYEPPFAIRTRAKTDSKNLRLYYNAGMLIFNWELDENQLRFKDPATCEDSGFKCQGSIESDKYFDLAWEFYPDGMRVLVDGKERVRLNGNYEKLKAAAGIGPAFGSVITMESFKVEALKGKLPE